MRSFEDADGRHWQAALLEASYGQVLLLFSPLGGNDIRRSSLPAEKLADAEVQLAALGEEELRAMLATAVPWGPGATG